MNTAIIHSIKNGAYTAIALYVAFVAVITVTSMNAASINAQTSKHAPIVVVEGAAVSVAGGA
ncbi:hypothetical protein [Pseudomonas sp. NA-150]|uniref:hypothetical protein n=1 Tax=Pseudomonas sp. NA-150 TaxID=3367525 RepID=UPI0037C6D11B